VVYGVLVNQFELFADLGEGAGVDALLAEEADTGHVAN
jgi:hypothetical protein